MLVRLGALGLPLLVALVGPGCRSVWRDPAQAPLLATLPRIGGGRAGVDASTACTPNVALAAAEDFAAEAARAERAGSGEASDHYYQAICTALSVMGAVDSATGEFQRASQIYHESLARLLVTARDERRFVAGQGLVINSPRGPTLVPVALHSDVWNKDDVLAIHAVGEYRVKQLSRQYRRSGWGVPVVVERRTLTGRFAEEEFLTPGTLFAATALVRAGPTGGMTLELFDPLHPDPAAVAMAPTPLASDLSAPFALRLASSPEMVNDWLSFFGVDAPTKEGLFFIEPYQPGKMPVVMVHGLLSNPIAWVDMANDLRAVPGFNDRFQLWAFRYDTGDPFLTSASRLRHDLDRAVATVGDGDPALSQMVLVGHSMGGLISELQASSSEDRLWNAVANRPLSAIVTTPETRQALQDMFFFDPQPNVGCVISLSAPHQGSNWAVRPIGRLGSMLAQPEPERTARHAQLIQDNPGVFSDEVAVRVPTSVDMLNPDSALLRAIATLPASSCVRFHTVFGFGRSNLTEGEGDGIVAVTSAASPRAASQTGVDASHMTIHRKLETVSEVVRILNERWSAYAAGATSVALGDSRMERASASMSDTR
jgi:hypothetical protein